MAGCTSPARQNGGFGSLSVISLEHVRTRDRLWIHAGKRQDIWTFGRRVAGLHSYRRRLLAKAAG